MTKKLPMEHAPPREVIFDLGGVVFLKGIEGDVESNGSCGRFAQAFVEAYWDGYKQLRWLNQREIANFLGVNVSTVKRLMCAQDKPGYIRGMKYGEICVIARKLCIPLDGPPDPLAAETNILRSVVAKIQEARWKAMPTLPEKLHGKQLDFIADLVDRQDGGILPAFTGGDFDHWLSVVQKGIATANPPIDSPPDSPGYDLEAMTVSSADWLWSRQYLSIFVECLIGAAEAVGKDPGQEWILKDAKELIVGMSEINQLLSAFRDSKQGGLEEAARKLHLRHPSAVHARLERVELSESDFHGPDAELGRLIMISKKYRPKAQALLAWRSEYGADAETQERRPPR